MGRALYDMEMNAIAQAVYYNGGTETELLLSVVVISLAQWSALSSHPDTTTSENRTTYCIETSDYHAYSQHLLFHWTLMEIPYDWWQLSMMINLTIAYFPTSIDSQKSA